MLIAAAAAAAVAVGAIIVGSRRREKRKYHSLHGSIERRIKLFGGMADNCKGERELCGVQRQTDNVINSFEMEGGARPAEYREMV